MLAMLSTVVVGAAALVLPLLCGALVLPPPDGPARPRVDPWPGGEGAAGPAARQR